MTVPQAKRSGGESDKQSQHESQQGGQLQHRGKDEEMGVMSPSSFFGPSDSPLLAAVNHLHSWQHSDAWLTVCVCRDQS